MRLCHEKTFATHDGIGLFYRHWPALTPTPKGAIFLLHRGQEHSGRMAHLVDELGLSDFAFFAWDARGHGNSPGPRGFDPSFATSVRDLQEFVGHVATEYGIATEDMAVVGQSIGAVIAATWAHDYAPNLRCLVLAAPAFGVKLRVPLARLGLSLLCALRGDTAVVNRRVGARYLTCDPARIKSYECDDLIAAPISARMLLALQEASDRVIADAAAITVPTQLLIAGADGLVQDRPQHAFFARLGAAIKEKRVLPEHRHDVLGERDRSPAVVGMRRFVLRCFAEPAALPTLLDADQRGFSKEEADALATKLPPWSARGLYWCLTRLLLKAAGWLSEGVRLGHRTGFDSGSTLDYVYENRPRGRSAFGRLLDRAYLDAVGWRGIRQRKLHVEELLRGAMARLRAAGMPARVLDIAAGHGRYVLEAAAGAGSRPESILLRDYSDLNVARGSALIEANGLADIARFEQGDAFSREALAGAAPRPTLGVVSGLYELFADNTEVRRSLAGLADAIPAGGYLVYTGQPWHPQLEFIARALTSHRQGTAWVMRRRSQAELDQLVASAGFRKIEQRIDEAGIFTVSLAQRVTP